MSSTVSIAQYAARAEAAEAKIAELTSLAAQIQAVAGGASGSSGSGDAGIGEFKNYFLEKLKTLRTVVAEEHEEFVRTQAKNSELEKEVTKLRYRVEILTRELSAKLGTPVPESIFKDFKEEAETSKEVKNENPKEKDKKGKEKEKDKKGDKGDKEKEKDKKGDKEKEKDKKGDKEKEKDKKGDKEKDKGDKEKDKKGERKPSEKAERKPSEKAERKPSERKQSEKVETPAASTEPTVTVHASEGADKGKKAAKGKEQGKKEDATPAEAGESKKAEPKKGGEKPKKDSVRTGSEKGEAAAPDAKKGGKPDAKKGGDAQKKGGDNQKKGGEAAKKEGDKPKEEAKKSGELDDKAVKASLKEGGKKAQDCVGMSTFGTHFFCITVESADGKMKLLEKVMEGMNAEVDEEAEDRKGGAADLGKILFNANDQKLVIMCHTPKEVADKATAADWMKPVLEATGAKITSQTENLVQAELDNDPDHGIYSLKLRDQGISASFEFLRSRGLMIEDDSDDENYAAAAGINLNAAPGADY